MYVSDELLEEERLLTPTQTKMYFEDQGSIVSWQNATFGPPEDIRADYARANEEVIELLLSVSIEGRIKEMADVLIVLSRPAEQEGVNLRGFDGVALDMSNKSPERLLEEATEIMSKLLIDMFVQPTLVSSHMRSIATRFHLVASAYGYDLNAAIDEKMATNRKRQWNLTGGGHGYHV